MKLLLPSGDAATRNVYSKPTNSRDFHFTATEAAGCCWPPDIDH
ncbi:MAG: hypothetical protein ABI261_05340 [Ginsengibacter sp.]